MRGASTDHFSGHASHYAKFRPSYPTELFAWLSAQSAEHDLAWDCGTGNGQAALALADFFSHVHATDLSQAQLDHAPPRPNISYLASAAEKSELPAHSADVVTVAQALHWFNHEAFYAEVARVVKPGGLIAAWTYRLLDAEPAINELIAHFHSQTVGAYWPAERRWVDSGYRDLPFPFVEVTAPDFAMERHWTMNDLLEYLRTWSATQRYIKDRGNDPTLALTGELRALWGEPDTAKPVRWPLAMRCGRLL